MGWPPQAESKLFTPLKIGGGKITLKHRVILAPLTRNRGTPLRNDSTAENPNRIWYPNGMMETYYKQRATDGGLLITEGIPPSLEGNAMPGVPGLFTEEQAVGWRRVVEAVHEKGAFIYAQLWHSGRANVPQMTGTPILGPSATPWDNPEECFMYPAPGTNDFIKYADFPPKEMSDAEIKATIDDHCRAAKTAMDIGFDGVELHAGNGYIAEQFLSSNINKRTDEYGGTPQKRCTFVLEMMDAMADAVGGAENLAIRLSPFGLFNQTRSEERVETWSYLCTELKRKLPKLSYVSFIEPRYEQIFSVEEKQKFLDSWGLSDVDLSLFRAIFADTPFFSAGGWDDSNIMGLLESGRYDALLFGRYFISNPDLVDRLKNGRPLSMYDRSRFYGPFEDNAVGYVDYPSYQAADQREQRKEKVELLN